MGTLQLQTRSASPCLLPGTQKALPCQHGLDLNLLNCKVTQTPTALQHPHKAATKMPPSVGCLLPPYVPQFQAQRPPTHPSTLSQLTPSTPSSGSCCVPSFSSHSDTVILTLVGPAPTTRPAGSLHCLLPLGHLVLSHFCCLSPLLGPMSACIPTHAEWCYCSLGPEEGVPGEGEPPRPLYT